MRDFRAYSAMLAGWVVLSLGVTAEAAVYKTPTRQKNAVRTQTKAKPPARTVSRGYKPVSYTTPTRQPAVQRTQPAPRTQPAAQPVRRAPAATRQTQVARVTRAPAPQSAVVKSSDMLALEALERMPVPVAPKRVPATSYSRPTTARSTDSQALDALMQ